MVGLLKLCDVHWSSSTSLPCSIALDTEVVEATRQEYVLFLRAPIYDGRPSVRRHEPDFRVETIKPKAFRPPKDWSNRSQMTRDCSEHSPPSRRATTNHSTGLLTSSKRGGTPPAGLAVVSAAR